MKQLQQHKQEQQPVKGLYYVAPGIQHISRVTGNIENLDGTYFACCVAGQACNLDETGTINY